MSTKTPTETILRTHYFEMTELLDIKIEWYIFQKI
jgi:hypothetical protein